MALDEPITIGVQTLTPVWTGDFKQETSYLRATSFLGGLRFWTEALLRSAGKEVCNITSDDTRRRCLYDPKNESYACSACKIFGCTNLGRSFRMQVADDEGLEFFREKKRIDLPEQEYYRNNQKRIPSYFPKGGLTGSFSIILSPLRHVPLDAYLKAGLKLMLDWGHLGAQDQYGQGLVQAETASLQADFTQHMFSDSEQAPYVNDLPDFRDFFFFTSGIEEKSNQEMIKVPFLVRNKARKSLKTNRSQTELRHYFCGKLKPKQGTKYNISLHKNRLYGWGWFPRHGEYASSRNVCLDNLKSQLGKVSQSGSLMWKEYNSPRDPDAKSSWSDYVFDMLNNTWR